MKFLSLAMGLGWLIFAAIVWSGPLHWVATVACMAAGIGNLEAFCLRWTRDPR